MLAKSTVLERVIDSAPGDFSPEVAQSILDMHFPAEDQARYEELAEKAQDGALATDEGAELDDFLNTNAFLMILQSKARMSLKAS